MDVRDDLRELVEAAEHHDDAAYHEWMSQRGLGDGLPVIRPTSVRLESMLDGQAADEELGVLPPLMRPTSVADVAVVALLAGCNRDALPWVATAIRGIAVPEFNLLGVSTTTGNVAVYVALHGPGAARLRANAGSGCLAPGNRSNATIGRAVALSLQLLAGAAPGTIDMATIGQPAKFGACFAEGDPPGSWNALSVERGVEPSRSAVTVLAASSVVEAVDGLSQTGEGLLETLATAMVQPAGLSGDRTCLGGGEQFVLMPPEWATMLQTQGWSKADVRSFLLDRTQIPVDRLSPSLREHLAAEVRMRGVIPSAKQAEDIVIFVTGGPGTKCTHLMSWPGGTQSVTLALAP